MVDLLIEGKFPNINKPNKLIAMVIVVIKFNRLDGMGEDEKNGKFI